jgi:hypothetical protein
VSCVCQFRKRNRVLRLPIPRKRNRVLRLPARAFFSREVRSAKKKKSDFSLGKMRLK